MAWYIDTAEIQNWIATNTPELVASELLRTELLRTVRRSGATHELDVDDGLAAVDLLPVTTAILDAAALIEPVGLHSLDAVHLATAVDLSDDCEGVITYDDRLADAARQHGLGVVTPR